MILSSLALAFGLAAAPALDVAPATGLADAPLQIRAQGLAPVAVAQIVATTSSNGKPWVSVATCRADAAGRVDSVTCDSTAGTYTGVDPGGLIWSMQPQVPGDTKFVPPAAGQPVEYAIDLRVAGATVASAHAT